MLTKLLVMMYLAILAITDVWKKEIPMRLFYIGMIPAGFSVVHGIVQEGRNWEDMILGLIPGAILLCISALGKGAGIGDGLILLQLNLYLFMEATVLAFAISLLAIGFFSLLLLLAGKGKKDTRIPYLPFLWLGCLGTVFL